MAAHTSTGVATPRNRLLAAMTASDLSRLRPHLKPVQLSLRHILHKPDEPITAAYFPEYGWASMLLLLADGNAAEVGLIGLEGMVGIPLLLGSDRGPIEVMVQAPGTFLRIEADALKAEIDRNASIRTLLLRYALAFHAQVTQTAACNGHHALEQRLARWLLMAHDRAQGDEFPMTQEFLAVMLCVHRPGVTVAARLLHQAGYIRYSNGQITVTDRAGLEAVACECHVAVASEFTRLLGPDWH